ncbi:23S rRNA (guanosine(2251)-2'-O)-methyltransferase RlmB [Staphylococcus cohnii]|uniref:Putative TrmH family tRNA/rRNA methyltransferase n=1 Tax=Staphylococcus cohnii subsp. cohnii TaxID=74704 RepID=A0A0M2NWU8_STACC|nr:23S rRNA (guanosine(2251)-2'-O)-methyltransferase RlmB [Staphylococcus cohnii]TGP63568.1 23S rRNA (guanosine(2251)-2'-O)-methyltransferase RlmB [bacterium M00.F.Ca.ET.229.01.1.1]TGS39635.1 23S rRNA (guanosine(2251)-2'-O)-methyltransferase RlmB [bacterium M00.F.Ca.ET.180.01.1.1]AYX88937.1 23S rRNA (guanosine(2251)-2'-O)-methyltransferase RlmB [Staphylococcus cohnii]KKI64211.1 23S rRNA (guanosine-2'-O-) -methyltransferase rlmB [Staphylococcus cohnii subsp. cohnii]MDE1709511.1 23S rRNA (guanos
MEEIVIVGRHAVKEAIVSGHTINKVLIQDTVKKGQINDILKKANSNKIIVQAVPKSKLDGLSDAPHQGVAAYIAPYEYADFDAFLVQQKDNEKLSTVLILDGLEDPHNLGSILRTADASGVDGIIIPKRRSVALTQTVAKASTGAIEHVPVMRVTNLANTIETLKEHGYWVVGTEAENSTDYREMDAGMPLAIVIGSEGQGMSRLTKDKCDFYINIPMVGHVNSLNASVAASLMMYEVYRKRNQIGEKP